MAAVAGMILAGGQSRRMGGRDKALLPLGGQPLIGHVCRVAAAQTAPLVINANGDPARFDFLGLPVVADAVTGFAGPLAGVLTGLEWVWENVPEIRWLATFPADAPFLPDDLVTRLVAALQTDGADMARAASRGRAHPVIGLWPVAAADDLRRALVDEDIRKVDIWTARYSMADVAWPTDPFDPFMNINRPEDLAAAEARLVRDDG
ncbi:MAG: molybdenum cofactor guanylyltransferase MobA [Magnetospiraceae bacterium]